MNMIQAPTKMITQMERFAGELERTTLEAPGMEVLLANDSTVCLRGMIWKSNHHNWDNVR